MSYLSSHAADNARAATVMKAIDEWNAGLDSDDRRAKYEKMAESAFVFYRGTNHIVWADLAADARLQRFGGPETRTWLQGDLHTDNFGAFGNDEGRVVYDINDFDESVIADYQYDLWRMAVSIVLVAGQNDDLSSAEQGDVVDAFAASHVDTLGSYLGNRDERDTVFTKENTTGRLDNFLEELEEECSRARMLKKWTRVDNDERYFDLGGSEGKLAKVPDAKREGILAGMQRYEETLPKRPKGYHGDYFKVKDIACRLSAGTGSLGVPRYYVLIEGETDALDDDCILDVKLQTKPTAYHYLGLDTQEEYLLLLEYFPGCDARWHEAAYRALARHTDDHLGWMELAGAYYSVRERSFLKETFPTSKLKNKTRFKRLAEQWGKVIATDHARALSDFDREYFMDHGQPAWQERLKEEVCQRTEGRLDEFQDLVREIAFGYAEQVQADWRYFVDAFEQL